MNRFRKYKPAGVPVSYLANQLWCEMQLDLKLTSDIKPEITEEIIIGKEKHRELEEELVDVIDVKPRTFEDFIFLEFSKDLQNIRYLKKEAIVREIPVLGELNGILIKGVVDEIRMMNGSIMVCENKTRRKHRMPSKSQLKCNKFQVMIYWRLLRDLIDGKFSYDDFSKHYNLNPDNITVEFLSEFNEKVNSDFPTNDLNELIKIVFKQFTELPSVSGKLSIKYIHQSTNDEIGEKKFIFDIFNFKKNMDHVSEYWIGKRDAIPVGEGNKWKCTFCDFASACPKTN